MKRIEQRSLSARDPSIGYFSRRHASDLSTIPNFRTQRESCPVTHNFRRPFFPAGRLKLKLEIEQMSTFKQLCAAYGGFSTGAVQKGWA
jgi:hypothetical protein